MLVFLKFIIAGFLGVTINFSSTFILKEFLKFHKYFANSISLTIALIANFFLNRIWTFEAYNQDVQIQILKFILIVLISILFNHIIVYFCHNKFSISFYVSKIIAVIIIFFWNFTMHLNFTFNI